MKNPVPKTPEERSETEEIILDNFCGCCSSSDCTGLIPSDPTSETAADEYRNVYPYAVPDSDGIPYTKNKKRLTERGYARRCVNIKGCRIMRADSLYLLHIFKYIYHLIE